MDVLLKALDRLQVVLANPALSGGSSLRTSEASEILRLIISLAQDGEDGGVELEGFVGTLTTMGEKGRGPTPLEWESIRGCQAAYDAPEVEDAQEEEPSGDEEEETVSSDTPEEETSEETQIEE